MCASFRKGKQPKESECQRAYREVDEQLASDPNIRDIEHPHCTEDGLFAVKQCIAWLNKCHCVDPYTGDPVRAVGQTEDCGRGMCRGVNVSTDGLKFELDWLWVLVVAFQVEFKASIW